MKPIFYDCFFFHDSAFHNAMIFLLRKKSISRSRKLTLIHESHKLLIFLNFYFLRFSIFAFLKHTKLCMRRTYSRCQKDPSWFSNTASWFQYDFHFFFINWNIKIQECYFVNIWSRQNIQAQYILWLWFHQTKDPATFSVFLRRHGFLFLLIMALPYVTTVFARKPHYFCFNFWPLHYRTNYLWKVWNRYVCYISFIECYEYEFILNSYWVLFFGYMII